MRLDKFLKVSRIIKRRTLSKEISEASRVKVNGKVAKPATKLKIGDIIEIEFGRTILKVQVKELKEHVLKNDSSMLYDIIEEIKKEILSPSFIFNLFLISLGITILPKSSILLTIPFFIFTPRF